MPKKFDINKHWSKCCIDIEGVGHKNSLCWLDKRNYEVYYNFHCLTDEQKKEIDNDEANNFLLLPLYVDDFRYKELIKELDNPRVTQYFNDATDEDDACFRYRCFIDWNGLELSEWYKTYLIVSDILINWCIANEIPYEFELEEPPINYVYSTDDYKNDDWIVSEDEIQPAE